MEGSWLPSEKVNAISRVLTRYRIIARDITKPQYRENATSSREIPQHLHDSNSRESTSKYMGDIVQLVTASVQVYITTGERTVLHSASVGHKCSGRP